jgi:cytochrome c biogenesis protein ResB
MKTFAILGWAVLAAALPGALFAQEKKRKASEEDFVKIAPAIGDPFPALGLYDVDGKEIEIGDLKGHHVVLTFGCLT